MEIKVSDKFAKKLLKTMFEPVDQSSWYKTTVNWITDSKYRNYTRLDSFLQEQIDNPNTELLEEAQRYIGMEYDDIIVAILKDVKARVKYRTDNSNYGMAEYWAQASKTLGKGYGDCDDMNSLVYVLARLAGVPSFMLYCAIGDTNLGGHFWCIYFSPTTGLMYSIDSTFYPDVNPISIRRPFIINDDSYQNIWYLFNEKGVWRCIS